MIFTIKNFPEPKNITDARSWFSIVNQIAWAYSNSPTMQPFRELVKLDSIFQWDGTLDKLFEEWKRTLIDQWIVGICSFDTNPSTCLQTDWCR